MIKQVNHGSNLGICFLAHGPLLCGCQASLILEPIPPIRLQRVKTNEGPSRLNGCTVIKMSITFTIAPRVPLTELSLRAGCISNLRSTVVFKKLHLNCPHTVSQLLKYVDTSTMQSDKFAIFIDCVSSAKQGDNALGSVRPFVCLFFREVSSVPYNL